MGLSNLDVEKHLVEFEILKNQLANIIKGVDVFVPYTGATGNVDLGNYGITSNYLYSFFNAIIGLPVFFSTDATDFTDWATGTHYNSQIQPGILSFYDNVDGSTTIDWELDLKNNAPNLKLSTATGTGDFQIDADVDLLTNNLTTTGKGTLGELDVDTLNFNGNSITDSTGAISFGDENGSTTGTWTAASYIGTWAGTDLTADQVPDHDDLNNVSANEHIDWTDATENLKTTGIINTGDYATPLAQLTVSGTSGSSNINHPSTIQVNRITWVRDSSGGGLITGTDSSHNVYWMSPYNGSSYNISTRSGYSNWIRMTFNAAGGIYLYDNLLYGTGNIQIQADNKSIGFGATNTDLKISSDGTNGIIDVDTSLRLGNATTNYTELEATGFMEANGTARAWKDINMSSALLSRPSSSQPDIVSYVDETGTDTNIETYGFDVGEKVHGGFEMQHDYAEGTDFTFHVHWQGITAPSGTDNVQWRLTYTVLRDGQTLDAVTTIDSPDTTFDTQYEAVRSDFAAITGTNYNIGDQFVFTLERVAATGDAYAGDALIATVGIHYQVNTIGSRTIIVK